MCAEFDTSASIRNWWIFGRHWTVLMLSIRSSFRVFVAGFSPTSECFWLILIVITPQESVTLVIMSESAVVD